jgi:hypothetical protein
MGIVKPLHVIDPNWASIQAFTLFGLMISDFEREIAQSRIEPEDQVFYQQCLPGLCAAMSPLICHQPWKDNRLKITEVDITRLDNVDRLLRRYVDERELKIEEFGKLIASIEEALACVSDSELPNQLKDFIASQLISVRNAVDQYKYRGMVGIQQALSGYLGALGSATAAIEKSVNKEGKTKFMEVLQAGNALVTLAHGAAWAWPHIVLFGQAAAQLLG